MIKLGGLKILMYWLNGLACAYTQGEQNDSESARLDGCNCSAAFNEGCNGSVKSEKMVKVTERDDEVCQEQKERVLIFDTNSYACK
jgi:hypothetical protein